MRIFFKMDKIPRYIFSGEKYREETCRPAWNYRNGRWLCQVKHPSRPFFLSHILASGCPSPPEARFDFPVYPLYWSFTDAPAHLRAAKAALDDIFCVCADVPYEFMCVSNWGENRQAIPKSIEFTTSIFELVIILVQNQPL